VTELNTRGNRAATGTGDRSRPRAALLALCPTRLVSWGIVYWAFPSAIRRSPTRPAGRPGRPPPRSRSASSSPPHRDPSRVHPRPSPPAHRHDRRVRTRRGQSPDVATDRLARAAATRRRVRNATWVLGSDSDVPVLGELPGPAVAGDGGHGTGTALDGPSGAVPCAVPADSSRGRHRRDRQREATVAAERRVVTSATDLSGRPFRHESTASCGTGTSDRARYARALEAAGCEDVHEQTASGC
jgi:hypothetical protein